MGKYLTTAALSIAIFSLVSCEKPREKESKIPEGYHLYESSEGYSTAVPQEYSFAENAPSKDYYYFGYPKSNKLGLGTVEFRKVPSCDRMGVTKPDSKMQGPIKILLGKIDFFEKYGHDYEPTREPYCRPYESGAGYSLCSQHNGKTVLICISQRVDNPALAEEIFKTFRWK